MAIFYRTAFPCSVVLKRCSLVLHFQSHIKYFLTYCWW